MYVHTYVINYDDGDGECDDDDDNCDGDDDCDDDDDDDCDGECCRQCAGLAPHSLLR